MQTICDEQKAKLHVDVSCLTSLTTCDAKIQAAHTSVAQYRDAASVC